MKKYYEVLVEMTSKPVGKTDKLYSIFNQSKEQFTSIKEVKEWLKDTYGNCKREKIYINDKDGKAQHQGYIYCFKGEDYSQGIVEHWYQQDWITVKEIKSTAILVK